MSHGRMRLQLQLGARNTNSSSNAVMHPFNEDTHDTYMMIYDAYPAVAAAGTTYLSLLT